MTKCIICGRESTEYLCHECITATNIEQLCMEISTYKLESMVNELWEAIAVEMKENGTPFKDMVFEIARNIPSPARENLLIKCLAARNKSNLQISDLYFPRFEEYAEVCLNSGSISETDKNRIKGLYLQRFFKQQLWSDADEVAEELYKGNHSYPVEVFLLMGEYYTHTRRYDRASELLNEGKDIYENETFYEYISDCMARRTGLKKEYLPADANKKAKYLEFIERLGITAATAPSKYTYDKTKPYNQAREKSGNSSSHTHSTSGGEYSWIHIPSSGVISEYDYPHFDFLSGNYKSFVAYDTETTGFGLKTDCIIEIGAFRVVDGVIRDEKRFCFQELIQPFAGVKGMSYGASAVNGITNDMLKDAKSVKEVFNDFADFLGDDLLIGFNNMRFDAPRLRRAGRYAGRVITNPQLDVMLYARSKGVHGKLSELAEMFGIENPNAHRAFADAWTTAGIYLALLGE